MKIVGCDFHPRWQQIAVFDTETGEITEHKLVNGDGEAGRFYRSLEAPALVGMEACGNSQWFIELLERLGHQVWIGDAAQIRASYPAPPYQTLLAANQRQSRTLHPDRPQRMGLRQTLDRFGATRLPSPALDRLLQPRTTSW